MTDVFMSIILVALACLVVGWTIGWVQFSSKPAAGLPPKNKGKGWHLKLETIDEALDGVAHRIESLEWWNRTHRERAMFWKAEAHNTHRELINAHKGIRRLRRRNDRLKKELGLYQGEFGKLDKRGLE